MADVTASVVNRGICYSNLTSGAVYARSCWDLHAYNSRIYVGGGNAATGSTYRAQDQEVGELKYWNPGTLAFVGTGFTPAENQVQTFHTFGSDLYVPGIDSETALGGNDTNEGFAREVSGTWTQYNQVFLNWSHNYDIIKFGSYLIAVGAITGSITIGNVKIATNGVGATSGAWGDMAPTEFGFRMTALFEANGKCYACHSIDNASPAPLYEYTNTTTFTVVKKSGVNLTLQDVMPSSVSGSPLQYLDRNNTMQNWVASKFWRPTNALGKTWYVGGEMANDHQIDPYGLFSVADGSAGTGIDVATFAKILHPNNGSITNPKPWDIWTDGSEVRVLWSYLDGSSNVVVSLTSTTNGSSWSELFTYIPNGVTQGSPAGGQTPAMAYEYLSGIHYFGLGSTRWDTSDAAVQANNGELHTYDTSTPATIYARNRPGASRRNRSAQQ